MWRKFSNRKTNFNLGWATYYVSTLRGGGYDGVWNSLNYLLLAPNIRFLIKCQIRNFRKPIQFRSWNRPGISSGKTCWQLHLTFIVKESSEFNTRNWQTIKKIISTLLVHPPPFKFGIFYGTQWAVGISSLAGKKWTQ